MGFVDTNWDDIQTSNAVPAGMYTLLIEAQEEKEGPKGPYLSWTFSIDGVVSIEDNEKLAEAQQATEQNRKVFLNTSLVPNSLWRLKRFIAAATGTMPTGSGFDPESLIGLRVQAKLLNEEYDGEPRTKVGAVSKIN